MTEKKPSPETTDNAKKPKKSAQKEQEFGGYEKKLEPTRYGDWDVDGRCSDF